MNNDINKILSQGDFDDSGKEKLLNDLISEPDRNIMSAADADDFEKDAAEGLQQLPEERIPPMVDHLNIRLQKHLKKQSRRKRKIPDQSMLYIIIITLLLLIVIAYYVIKRSMS